MNGLDCTDPHFMSDLNIQSVKAKFVLSVGLPKCSNYTAKTENYSNYKE